jgi:transposase
MMATTSMTVLEPLRVTVGVDTHKDTHVAQAKDQLGRRLDGLSVPADADGYRTLLAWAQSQGELEAFGIEGTGSYGAGLARYLRDHDVTVVEVIRPNRQARRRNGKSDPADADAAASAVLAREATGQPKTADGAVEMIRVLRVARSTAITARGQAVNALKALIVTAPDALRDSLRGLSTIKQIRACTRLRPGTLDDPLAANKTALRALAARYEALEAEIKALDEPLRQLAAATAPALLEIFGLGVDCAGALLVAAGDNPERVHSEAAFAMLTGTAPVEASSGKTIRHRLNRGGDRQANSALYHVVMVRLRWHQPTRNYVDRRTAEGKSKREIIRCLKRYVAREVYAALQSGSAGKLPTAPTRQPN